MQNPSIEAGFVSNDIVIWVLTDDLGDKDEGGDTHDWQSLTNHLHRDALTLPLSLRFRDEQMANIRQGFMYYAS